MKDASIMFPLVQLPKKFKDSTKPGVYHQGTVFPLVQLPKKFKAVVTRWKSACVQVSISSTSEEV